MYCIILRRGKSCDGATLSQEIQRNVYKRHSGTANSGEFVAFNVPVTAGKVIGWGGNFGWIYDKTDNTVSCDASFMHIYDRVAALYRT